MSEKIGVFNQEILMAECAESIDGGSYAQERDYAVNEMCNFSHYAFENGVVFLLMEGGIARCDPLGEFAIKVLYAGHVRKDKFKAVSFYVDKFAIKHLGGILRKSKGKRKKLEELEAEIDKMRIDNGIVQEDKGGEASKEVE